MSINLKAYADTALDQGKQVFGTGLSTAQAQVADVTGKAAGAMQDLRAQAEKAINLDAVKHAVEPYLSQVKGYTASVTDRAEGLYRSVTADPRVAKLVATAGSVSGTVVLTVQDKVVAPVQQLTGRRARHTAPAARTAPAAKASPKPAAKATTRPAAKATTRPAAKATTKPAAKSTAHKPAAKPTA